MANLAPKSTGNGKSVPEKSNFAQTCNLLSQYVKERGSLGDLSLGINGKLEAKGPEASRTPATTLNLLTNIENSAETSMASANIKPMNFFPQFVNFASPKPIEDDSTSNKPADFRKSSKAEPGTDQLTIFYAGQVVVYNDFPADKAKEIMDLVRKASSISKTTNSTPPNSKDGEGLHQLHPQANGSGLPIVAKISLHRFFEKRKDRIASKAPYQINNPSSPPRRRAAEERNPIIVDLEGESSKQFDLNL